MIVEFIGSPGIGKTSICSMVMEGMAANGYDVRMIDRDEYSRSKLYRRVLNARASFSPRTRNLRTVFRDYDEIIRKDVNLWNRHLLKSVIKIEQRYVKKCDHVFFEEGPTQYLTSIFHMEKIDEQIDPLISEINRSFYDHDVIAFYFYADVDDIIERLKTRNRKKDRFLKEDTDEMRSMLETKIYNLEYVMKKMRYGQLYRIENRNLDDAASQVRGLICRAQPNK